MRAEISYLGETKLDNAKALEPTTSKSFIRYVLLPNWQMSSPNTALGYPGNAIYRTRTQKTLSALWENFIISPLFVLRAKHEIKNFKALST